MLNLDEAAVHKLLQWDPLIDAMDKALIDLSQGRVNQPARNMMVIEEGKKFLGVMPAASDTAMGLKLVSFYPVNAGTGVPSHSAMILLFDPKDGQPLAVLDGRLITEMRTAATSAAVARRIVPDNVSTLAILGSGVQAQSHLEAMTHIRKFSEIKLWSRTAANAEKFAAAHKSYGVKVTADAASAVKGADIVVTATSSMTPVLEGAWLKPGAFVASVGAPRPNWREMDDACMANVVIADQREACAAESGDVILSKCAIYAEAGEVLSGSKPAPKGKTTIFKSVGLAVEDLVTARLVYDAALKAGMKA